MKLLLDTHIFIWWADQPEKLSPAALSALEDEANELLLNSMLLNSIDACFGVGYLTQSPQRSLRSC
jgi:PIN domain nuclease of toxin-antitoxin system